MLNNILSSELANVLAVQSTNCPGLKWVTSNFVPGFSAALSVILNLKHRVFIGIPASWQNFA